ncbi:conserved hypothetical protein [Histoplasma capsulatum G186AR]|uniref:Uncharacterized protein n=1 Tax=Ajellomyces capsulatus (strain G186AR / H82 / ATCC MYA-2454 / RMSCC 2432) TaxID=447093 RepID=C0NVU1_AJECG|nr:uncharacterized protein HCBG_07271 [Histoplasma capsulatum G186AR]EEH04630.1 conserved hypothetical protein [Histoplasma capsulatum G186AR]
MVLSHLGCTQCISRKRALLILGLKSPSTSFQCSCPCPCPFSASGDLSKDVASEMGADFSAMPSTVSGLDDINRDDWILTLPQLLFPHRHFTVGFLRRPHRGGLPALPMTHPIEESQLLPWSLTIAKTSKELLVQ